MEFPTNYFMINNEEQESVSSDWERIRAVVASVREEAAKVIVGQADVVDQMLVSLLCRGHCLIVGVPGLAKTLLVGTLGRILGLDFKRIQFTPDLMPPDILGSEILQTSANGSRAFEYVPGPVFTNLLLADEINRTPPKTQAALLEAMQEKQVTVAGKTRTLAEPFIVYATQNPLEHEGTYPLPEAQLDRFLFKINVGRNPAEVLTRIVLNREMGVEPAVPRVLDAEELLRLMGLARRIAIPDAVAGYIGRLVNATHPGESEAARGVKYGASPRAALGLAAAAKARALRQGRPFCSFEDVQAVIRPVLEHRILLDHMAKLEGATPGDVVERLLTEIPAQDKPLPHSLAAAKIH